MNNRLNVKFIIILYTKYCIVYSVLYVFSNYATSTLLQHCAVKVSNAFCIELSLFLAQTD